MATTPSPDPNSKNPFLNPPKSNNPFLRNVTPQSTGSSSPQLAQPLSMPVVPTPTGTRVASPHRVAFAPDVQHIPDRVVEEESDDEPDIPEEAIAALNLNSAAAPPTSPSVSTPRPPLPPRTPALQSPQPPEPVSNPNGMTEDEALEAAIAASLHDDYLPPEERVSNAHHTRSASEPPTITPPSVREPTRQETVDSLGPPPEEELPPYSARPDVGVGEMTLETGPRRPFQRAPAGRPPQPTGSRIYPQTTGWSQYPGAANRRSHEGTLTPSLPSRSPGSPYLAVQNTGAGPSTSQPDLAMSGAFASPTGSPPSRQAFAPPPGPPPTRTTASTASSSRQDQDEEDDGKPTVAPTPGRPYLRNGKTLVYPVGYSCHKCNNTGYKSYDPSHPCSKCWDKYGKPYAGPLTYAPWANRSADSNFQKPLPKTFGPPSNRYNDWGLGSSSRSPIARNASSAQLINGPAPPGSTVVKPGDPRIGGRLCWNCGGDGWVSFFLFDQERCPTCRGMGRIL